MNKLPGTLAHLGKLFQLAYMAADFDEAVARWTALGVGPFYVMRGIALKDIHYRGELTELNIDIAFSYWGDIQIEVIRQNNEQPSIYIDWQKANTMEIHHLGVMVKDMTKARAYAEANGYTVVYHKVAPGHGEFMYVQTPHAPGLIEFIIHEPGDAAVFVRIQAEVANWDGTRPVRPFAELAAG